MKYNFDEPIDRSKNRSSKYDEREMKFGTYAMSILVAVLSAFVLSGASGIAGADPDKGLECLDGITAEEAETAKLRNIPASFLPSAAAPLRQAPAWQSVAMAMQDVFVYNVHGINGRTPEESIWNMGRIASPGMVGTEKTIVEILESKKI